MTYVILSHDPYTRQSFVRRLADIRYHGCENCGVNAIEHKLYVYGYQPDDTHGVRWSRGAFCGIGCYRTYHA